MKKHVIIICTVLTTLSIATFTIANWNDSEPNQLKASVNKVSFPDLQAIVDKPQKKIFTDFIYSVGTRFEPIKKSDIDKARSIKDFLPEDLVQRIVSYKTVEVILIKSDKELLLYKESDKRLSGKGDKLTTAQIKLLKSFDYSTNLKFRTDFQEKNKKTGKLEDSYATPHLTIVPEKQAKYENGKDALMEYLKENSKEIIANVVAEKLQPAKLFFTVTKKGTIENVKLDRSSNYPDVDVRMLELIKNSSGNWEPAENSKGEKVDQELVVSFGLMGC